MTEKERPFEDYHYFVQDEDYPFYIWQEILNYNERKSSSFIDNYFQKNEKARVYYYFVLKKGSELFPGCCRIGEIALTDSSKIKENKREFLESSRRVLEEIESFEESKKDLCFRFRIVLAN